MEIKDNNNGFFEYVSSKKMTSDCVGVLLNEVSVLVAGNAEKPEVLNAFFALVFTVKSSHWEFQTLEIREKVLGNGRHALGQKFSSQTSHIQIHGPQWDASTSAEGAGRSGYQAALYCL